MGIEIMHTNFHINGTNVLGVLIGAVLLNVKCGDYRRRVGDACVTFLLGLFRRRRIGDVRRRRSATQSQ